MKKSVYGKIITCLAYEWNDDRKFSKKGDALCARGRMLKFDSMLCNFQKQAQDWIENMAFDVSSKSSMRISHGDSKDGKSARNTHFTVKDLRTIIGACMKIDIQLH